MAAKGRCRYSTASFANAVSGPAHNGLPIDINLLGLKPCYSTNVKKLMHNSPAPPCPVLGVCGHSGAGKTTLLEEILPVLGARGLSIAVVKHDAHGIQVDRAGKDSDRLFRAGAEILLQGPDESFLRTRHGRCDDLALALIELSPHHDLILIEGHKHSPCPKIWLQDREGGAMPAGLEGVVDCYPFDEGRAARLLDFLDQWLPEQWRRPPVHACVLIGGKSRRMGRDKHLIQHEGKTWLERTVETLAPLCETVVISGGGRVPQALNSYPRLPDAPGLQGPVAGILACMRWAPHANWLVCACDMPDITKAALEWLLAQRRPGVWGILPRRDRDAPVEPLFALYDWRARHLLEAQTARGTMGPHAVATHGKVVSPPAPPSIVGAWRNVNTPPDLC